MPLARSLSSPTMNVTNSERVLKSYCKAKGYERPIYRITSRSSTWVDGKIYRFKHYVCVVSVNGFSLAEGDGFSKRLARKKAAMLGLQQLRVCELQSFWQVFHTIVPQGLLKDADRGGNDPRVDIGSTLTIDRKLMITTSAVQIEEILPSEGIMTPRSLLQFSMAHTMRSEKPESLPQRERPVSVDSSSSLINAAIEKLRRYDDDEDDAGWERKEKEEKQMEIKKEQEKTKPTGVRQKEEGRKEKPAFSDEEMLMFNEKKAHHKKGNDIREIIEGVTKEIEEIEENGHDDLGL